MAMDPQWKGDDKSVHPGLYAVWETHVRDGKQPTAPLQKCTVTLA